MRSGDYAKQTEQRVERRDNDRNDRRVDTRRDWRDQSRTNSSRRDNERWRDGNNNRWRDNDKWRDSNRRDYRDARRWDRKDWRRDKRYDWRDYRARNRSVYRIGRYYSPYSNYSYRRIGIGFSLGSLFYGSRYWIDDPWSYRLPEVYGPYRWVRYYDDVLLVDIYTGEVVDVIYDFFW
ncbi:conserved hypothetical protein [Novosphingobium sp. PP1Y]|nr:conserved hypothetical protein [Novosphingobium sp. PP1Y]